MRALFAIHCFSPFTVSASFALYSRCGRASLCVFVCASARKKNFLLGASIFCRKRKKKSFFLCAFPENDRRASQNRSRAIPLFRLKIDQSDYIVRLKLTLAHTVSFTVSFGLICAVLAVAYLWLFLSFPSRSSGGLILWLFWIVGPFEQLAFCGSFRL